MISMTLKMNLLKKLIRCSPLSNNSNISNILNNINSLNNSNSLININSFNNRNSPNNRYCNTKYCKTGSSNNNSNSFLKNKKNMKIKILLEKCVT